MGNIFSGLRKIQADLDVLWRFMKGSPSFGWAVVTSVDPLQIRYDGQADPVVGSPSRLVSGLAVGDRVWCQRIHRRDIILGKGQGEKQKVLASGNAYMHAAARWDLSEPISQQHTGIVLVFSAYQAGGANHQWSSHFVPRQAISTVGPGYGWSFQVGLGDARKYLYISDSYITGYADNSIAPNDEQALRYVIGV